MAFVSCVVSEDYGKTFQDVTHLINHTFVQAEFGLGISPDRSGKVNRTLLAACVPHTVKPMTPLKHKC